MVSDPDPHYYWKVDPEQHCSEKAENGIALKSKLKSFWGLN
jgi:hypothetical protein